MGKIDKFLLQLLADTFSTLAQAEMAGNLLKQARDMDGVQMERVLTADEVGDKFKRKVREHLINSRILRDALDNYQASLDTLDKSLEAELLDEEIVEHEEPDVPAAQWGIADQGEQIFIPANPAGRNIR